MPTLESLASLRRRIYGDRLDALPSGAIVMGVANTDKHLAAFLTSSALANEYSGLDWPIWGQC